MQGRQLGGCLLCPVAEKGEMEGSEGSRRGGKEGGMEVDARCLIGEKEGQQAIDNSDNSFLILTLRTTRAYEGRKGFVPLSYDGRRCPRKQRPTREEGQNTANGKVGLSLVVGG